MPNSDRYEFHVKFPGNLDYIPAVRKYVSETLLANNFDARFAYRSEIIVDEICNNAVKYGCISVNAVVDLQCIILDDRIELIIRDEGGKAEDRQNLTEIVARASQARMREPNDNDKDCLGLEIVRMLSDKVSFEVTPDNLTTVRVVKVREDDGQNRDEIRLTGGRA